MSSLPSQHPNLSLHLTDSTLTPLITSSSSQSQLESLTALTSSAISDQSALDRARLGRPRRIMVEYPDRGPVVLGVFLDPKDVNVTAAAASATAAAAMVGSDTSETVKGKERDGRLSVVGIPVAPTDGRSEVGRGNGADAAISTSQEASLEETEADVAPMLLGIVVAGSAEESYDARRAASKLERVGRDFQRVWQRENDDGDAESTEHF